MYMYGNDWGNVTSALQGWVKFQQQSMKETMDFCASLSPVTDMQQKMHEMTAFSQQIDPQKVAELFRSPSHYTQCAKELIEIQQAAIERFSDNDQQLASVMLESSKKTNEILQSGLPLDTTLANLINGNVEMMEALKAQQGAYMGNIVGLQSALKAWSVRSVSE